MKREIKVKKNQKKTKNLLGHYNGKSVVIHTKSNVHVLGKYKTFHLGMLKIEDCHLVYAGGGTVALNELLLDRNAIHSMYAVEDIKTSTIDADTKRFISTITKIKG